MQCNNIVKYSATNLILYKDKSSVMQNCFTGVLFVDAARTRIRNPRGLSLKKKNKTTHLQNHKVTLKNLRFE